MLLNEGDKIGPYTIRATAGQGGMATVYQAWHEGLHRYEALKVPRGAGDSAPDSAYILRLLTEARVAAGLHHPNIVAIHGVSEPLAPIPFFAMEWVEGRDLAKILAEKRAFSLTETTQILESVAAALDYAHQKGVVHRDIKPANILITDTEGVLVPKVVDFGISRAAEDEDGATKLTKSGMIVGTPEYMSPEQAGSGELVDYRTDIYSLAVVAYEMMLGKPPFTAGSGVSRLSILISHVRDIAPLFEKFPDFPREAGQVLLRALSKSPSDRPRTCMAFLREMREAAGPNTAIFATAQDFERTPFDSSRFDSNDDATIIARPVSVSGNGSGAPQTLPPQPSGAPTAISSNDSVYSLRARLEAAEVANAVVPNTAVPNGDLSGARPVTPIATPRAKLLETTAMAAPAPTLPVEKPASDALVGPRPVTSRVAFIAALGGLLTGAAIVFTLSSRNLSNAARVGTVAVPTPTTRNVVANSDAPPPPKVGQGSSPAAASAPRTERTTEIRDVAFQTQTKRSDSRPLGSTYTQQEGKKGKRRVIVSRTIQGGKEVSRRVVSDQIIQQPVLEIVVLGTRTAPARSTTSRSETRSGSRSQPRSNSRDEPTPRRRVRVRQQEATPRRAPRRITPRKAAARPAKSVKKRRAVREAPLPP
jgi:serine/threonine protein kinase